MDAPLFHCPVIEGNLVVLPEEEVRHARSVLRMKAGDAVVLVDGKGTRASGRLVGTGRNDGTVEVLDRTTTMPRSSGRIHMAVAPTKQIDRFEWFLEKATELGIERITPLITDRVERHRVRHDRLQKVLISAMKQSQRSWSPRLDEMTLLPDLLRDELPDQRLFGHCEGERLSIRKAYDPGRDVIVLIGPEGDFSPQEVEQLKAWRFVPITLGEARLRTETAALAACAWMDLAQGTP